MRTKGWVLGNPVGGYLYRLEPTAWTLDDHHLRRVWLTRGEAFVARRYLYEKHPTMQGELRVLRLTSRKKPK